MLELTQRTESYAVLERLRRVPCWKQEFRAQRLGSEGIEEQNWRENLGRGWLKTE